MLYFLSVGVTEIGMDVRSEIKGLIEERNALLEGRNSTVDRIQSRWLDSFDIKSAKKANRIRREIRAEEKEIRLGYRLWNVRIRRLGCRIRHLVDIHDIKPTPGDHKVKYTWVYEGSYRSQGFLGAERYYKAAMQRHLDDLEYSGFKAEPEFESGWVWALVSDPVLDGYLLKELKKISMVPYAELVRAKWARGINPRVDNPYLPHGYESEVGIDFFGNITDPDKFNAAVSS